MPAIHANLEIDETFPRSYDVEWLIDLPSSPNTRLHYLGMPGRGSGPILRVKTAQECFVIVVDGDTSNLRLSTWPDPQAFLALPSLVLVNTADPAASKCLPGFEGHSVHYIVRLADRGLVLIGHCCAIYCYDAAGLAWTIDAFCCEDPIIDVAGDVLTLIAHKHGLDPGNEPVPKAFDLMTGEAL